jgi:GDP-L-fucose synthase
MESSRNLVLGGSGLVGSALVTSIRRRGQDVLSPSSAELNLQDRTAVIRYFMEMKPVRVFMAAAVVGGILENSRSPVKFIRDNLRIQSNVFEAARDAGVAKLMMLGSSCIYPRDCVQPMKEEHLMTGLLEPTNSAYAMAKLAALEECRAYRSQYGCQWIFVVPPNVYGPRDHFYTEKSHVLSALMTRIHEAKRTGAPTVTAWGSGQAKREFIYSEDLAGMLLEVMDRYAEAAPLNTGTGTDMSIRDLAGILAGVVGYGGEVIWDTSKPDGMPRKLMDSSRLHQLGVRSRVELDDGIERTYKWFLATHPKA